MSKQRAEDQHKWSDMYVYEADVVRDLFELVADFIGECEHAGEVAECREISEDTVENLAAWFARRKQLLQQDFLLYHMNALDMPEG